MMLNVVTDAVILLARYACAMRTPRVPTASSLPTGNVCSQTQSWGEETKFEKQKKRRVTRRRSNGDGNGRMRE